MLNARLKTSVLWGALFGIVTLGHASNTAVAQLRDASYTKISHIATPVNMVKSSNVAPFLETAARDSDTYEEDRLITNACIESGGEKDACICETTVLKYELALRDYKAVAVLYEFNAEEAQTKLMSEGYEPAEISVIQEQRENMATSPNFYLRCTEAQSYYSANIDQ